MLGICGANCKECEYGKHNECKGCINTNGCPFGKKCLIASYLLTGNQKYYEHFKQELIQEINELHIPGIKKVKDLFPLVGKVVNLAYPLPNGSKQKILDDDEIYLGCEVECEFNDGNIISHYGIIANQSFLLVSEYVIRGDHPEIVLYKRR